MHVSMPIHGWGKYSTVAQESCMRDPPPQPHQPTHIHTIPVPHGNSMHADDGRIEEYATLNFKVPKGQLFLFCP